MDEKRNLDDLIKSSFDKINKGAPDSLWANLSSALDVDAESSGSTEKDPPQNPLDTKVKESFSSLNGKVPEHVWPAINRQLNIDRVWQGISNELDKSKPLFWPRTRIAAAILLLLLSVTGIYVVLNGGAVSPGIADRQEREISENGESTIAFGSEEVTVTGEKKEQKTRTLSQQQAVLDKSTSHTILSIPANGNSDKKDQKKEDAEDGNALQKGEFEDPKEIVHSVETKESSSYPDTKVTALEPTGGLSREQLSADEILSLKVISFPIIPEENTLLMKEETIPLDILPKQEIALELPEDKNGRKILNIRNFEAGPVWVYHNSWLLNNETRNSFDKNSLISTNPTYKQNWGLTLNYNLTGKSTLATEIHFLSKAGQQYKMYGEGEYLKKGLELQYRKIYIQYQRNLLERGKGIPSWLTVKAGVYGGMLQEKLGELRQEESRYASFDYGFRLALGQENKLGRIVIGYGLSTERGLKNVFRGTEKLPAAFNKTYIQNFGTY